MAEIFPEGLMPFLPSDGDPFQTPDTEAVIETINADLGKLLNMSPGAFWSVVQGDPSLTHCLDTFLRFRRRAYEIKNTTGCQSLATSQAYERVFLVLLRLVTDHGGPDVPDAVRQADILYNNWVLDIPKILDVCSIYGTDNRELVSEFLRMTFFLQPKYLDDLAGLVPVLAENLHELELSCWTIMPETQLGSAAILASWPDTLKYIQDICVNLSLMLELYRPSGAYLMREGGALLARLARIHDFLIPDLATALGDSTAAGDTVTLTVSSKGIINAAHLTFAVIQRLSFLLLKQAYLHPDLDGELKSRQVAEGRGEAIMTAILAVAQMDKENLKNTLLHQLNKKYCLGKLLHSMMQQGGVWIDDTQYEYLCMLMGCPKVIEESHDLGAPSSSSRQNTQDVEIASHISKIREIFPDHSDAYLSFCLSLCESDPSQVIQGLLDGSMPSENQADPWPMQSDQTSGARASSRDQGTTSSVFPASFLSIDSASDNIVQPEAQTSVRLWAQVSVAQGKNQMNRNTARVLASLDKEVKGLILHQENAQLEYEDEYDDSFDDLAAMGADGMADAEGDDQRTSVRSGRHDARPQTSVRPTGKRQQNNAKHQTTKPLEKSKPGKKLWLLNGRIYNYQKEGAREVQNQADAERLIQVEGEEIHGLGPGGNKPLEAQNNIEHSSSAAVESSRGGRGRQSGSAGRGRGRSGRNNASAGSHHRKERALRKGG